MMVQKKLKTISEIMTVPEVVICSFVDAKRLLKQTKTWPPADAIISIGDPGSKPPYGFRFIPYRLRLEFDDVEAGDTIPIIGASTNGDPVEQVVFPAKKHIDEIIGFAKSSKLRGDKTVVIHCEMGRARSTSAGFIYFAVQFGPGAEQQAIDAMIKSATAENFCPNETMIEIADESLGRGGRMIKALDKSFPEE